MKFEKIRNLEYENQIDFNEINKKLIKAYWMVCLIVTLAAVIIFVISLITGGYQIKHPGRPYLNYIFHYIILQAIYLSAIIITSTIASNYFSKKKEYALQSFVCVGAMILISVVLTTTNFTMGGIFISFAFASFIALAFIDKKPIIFAVTGGGFAYLMTFIFFLSKKAAQGLIIHRVEEIITMFAFLGSGAAIAFFILNRNKILIANIGKEAEKNNALIGIIKKTAVSLEDIGNELSDNMSDAAAEVNQITSQIQSIKSSAINQSAGVTETLTTMEQINVNIDKLNANVEKQTVSVIESSSAIEEMLANIQSVTNTLVKNTENVQTLMQASEVGRSGLLDVASDIQEIARESEGLLEINTVMENISSQTNLLSMNAAIEAAHAGDAGKGFAVVAEEIRKLAENSGEQSKTIGTVLVKIKNAIDKISRSTENVLKKFEAIDSGIKMVADQDRHIRNAMEEQGQGSKQVLEAIGDLNDITMQVKNGSIEMLRGSEEVINESRNLEKATQEIINGMNEMASGTEHINIAVQRVKDISGKNKESIGQLVNEVSRFKVD